MSLINSTTYYGKDADGFYSTALIKGTSKENFTLIPNVKSKVKMASINLGTIVQEDGCSFNASGDATLAQKTLEVCDLKVNLEICTETFWSTYLAEKSRAGSNNNEIPADFNTYLVDLIAKKTASELENTVWKGNQSSSPIVGICDGLIKEMLADGTVVDVAGATLSTSNIVSKLEAVYAVIPDAIINEPDMRIFVSVSAAKLYKQAQAAVATGNGTYYIGGKELDFLGIKIVECPGMPANTMVAAQVSNIWYGTDLLSDENSVKLIDMSSTTGDNTVRFLTSFKFGVSYAKGAEVVLFGTGS